MLPPIPKQLLWDSMTLQVCTSVDAWDNPTWDEISVSNVHIQNTNEVRKSTDNTEVVLRSVIFIDPVRSSPSLNYEALCRQSLAAGKPMRAIVQDAPGNQLGNYEILIVDTVPDVPDTRVHHIELGCV
mgnify:CR=1 FL=1